MNLREQGLGILLAKAEEAKGLHPVVGVGDEDELVARVADGVYGGAGHGFCHVVGAESEVEGVGPSAGGRLRWGP